MHMKCCNVFAFERHFPSSRAQNWPDQGPVESDFLTHSPLIILMARQYSRLQHFCKQMCLAYSFMLLTLKLQIFFTSVLKLNRSNIRGSKFQITSVYQVELKYFTGFWEQNRRQQPWGDRGAIFMAKGPNFLLLQWLNSNHYTTQKSQRK